MSAPLWPVRVMATGFSGAMATIINLTPHDLHLFLDPSTYTVDERGNKVAPSSEAASRVIPRHETPARVTMSTQPSTDIDGIPVAEATYGEIEGLPPYDDETDTFYVVSVILARAAQASGRETFDLLLTHDLVRDSQGRIVGCCGFCLVD